MSHIRHRNLCSDANTLRGEHPPGYLPFLLIAVCGAGCAPAEPNRLEAMDRVALVVKGQAFDAWVASTDDQRQRGLMFVTREEMQPLPDGRQRGMIFVFKRQMHARHGFWMRNTVIPLDVAFLRADGTVVHIATMTPLRETPYYPGGPYRMALEVNANTFARLGLHKGEQIEIPPRLLNRAR